MLLLLLLLLLMEGVVGEQMDSVFFFLIRSTPKHVVANTYRPKEGIGLEVGVGVNGKGREAQGTLKRASIDTATRKTYSEGWRSMLAAAM